MRRPRRGDVVEVAWVDSEHVAMGWDTVRAYRKVAGDRRHDHYRTTGYWLGRVRDRAVVAQSVSLVNGNITHVMSIPRISVTSITILRRARRGRRRVFR